MTQGIWMFIRMACCLYQGQNESDTRYPFKGNNSIIRLNGQTISADITIDADENGVSAGPITQSATVTVNGYWSIV